MYNTEMEGHQCRRRTSSGERWENTGAKASNIYNAYEVVSIQVGVVGNVNVKEKKGLVGGDNNSKARKPKIAATTDNRRRENERKHKHSTVSEPPEAEGGM